MFDKGKLFLISDLRIDGMDMDDAEFGDYCKKISAYIDVFPSRDDKAKDLLAKKDYSALAEELINLQVILRGVHAGKLADDCIKQAEEIEKPGANVDHEKLEENLPILLEAMAALSIDMQMASTDQKNAAAPPMQADDDSTESDMPTPEEEDPVILAVDDSVLFTSALKRYLENTPYKLICFNSGMAALSFIRDNDPSLFILDIEMPAMNGYELAGKIIEAGHKAPILFLTGTASKSAVLKAIQSGAKDFIIKPSNREMLLKKIEKHIC